VYLYTKAIIIEDAELRYNKILSELKDHIITNTPEAEMVKEVAIRLVDAADKWAIANGKPKYVKNYKWKFTLFDLEARNAGCLGGGEIAVFSGILPYTQTPDGLAAVLGHEIAHALLNHAQEDAAAGIWKYSAVMTAQANAGQGAALGADAAMTYLGTYPASRSQETAADTVGLRLMLIAGYNGEEAIAFWERMAASGSSGKSDFFSTHPLHEKRIENLKKDLPVAQELAQKILAHKPQ
jgi:predicted Zn-dependent protease